VKDVACREITAQSKNMAKSGYLTTSAFRHFRAGSGLSAIGQFRLNPCGAYEKSERQPTLLVHYDALDRIFTFNAETEPAPSRKAPSPAKGTGKSGRIPPQEGERSLPQGTAAATGAPRNEPCYARMTGTTGLGPQMRHRPSFCVIALSWGSGIRNRRPTWRVFFISYGGSSEPPFSFADLSHREGWECSSLRGMFRPYILYDWTEFHGR